MSAAVLASSGALVGILVVVYIVVIVFEIAALWQVFVKAGEAGWKAVIPIWNTLITLKIIGRHWWWIILLFIPIVNIVVWIVIAYDLARSFGKGAGYAAGLFFLSFLFIPILGFGAARYTGPAAGGPRAVDVY